MGELIGGGMDGCKAYWFLSTARLKSEVAESYQLRTLQTKEKRKRNRFKQVPSYAVQNCAAH